MLTIWTTGRNWILWTKSYMLSSPMENARSLIPKYVFTLQDGRRTINFKVGFC